jgi:hypothetical protein
MRTKGVPPEVLTLHRYFIWANRMRTHFDQILDRVSTSNPDISSGAWQYPGTTEIESFLYMSYWYAALYVVIEGWQELNLSDNVIDDLLNSQYVDLLKRYRNGVFHFQRDYHDQRFNDFMSEGDDVVTWVRSLNEQFGRYFLARSAEARSNARATKKTK